MNESSTPSSPVLRTAPTATDPAAPDTSPESRGAVGRRGFLAGLGGAAAALAARPVLAATAAGAATTPTTKTSATDPANDPVLDLADIQGNVVAGFHKDHQALVFVAFASAAAGRSWLARTAPMVASSREVASFNATFRAVVARSGSESSAPRAIWTNLALSHAGLAALGRPSSELTSFPEEFRAGMAARAALLGDTGASAPSAWPVEFQRPVHAVVIVAADDAADVEAEVERQRATARATGVEVVVVQRGDVRADEPGHEHFGFRDGISQPGVRGFTERRNPANTGQGVPGQDLLWPGEFVVGYARQPGVDGGDGPGPIAASGPAWTVNGSYLVFRRLRQDVAAFRDFVAHTAVSQGISEDLAGAKLVGRYRSGAPLEVTGNRASDPGASDASLLTDLAINDFEYGDDAQGKVVPLAAHIRKTYPRDTPTPYGGEADTQTHRLLRRGIPYGDSLPARSRSTASDDRGLLFLCYQSSIARQFEVVQHQFVNDAAFPAPGAGQDPVIAQDPATGSFALPGGRPDHVALMQRFVTTTGGEYFFAPSLRALTLLAAAPAPPPPPGASAASPVAPPGGRDRPGPILGRSDRMRSGAVTRRRRTG
ncbi:MAG: Dyp-type peroxidase [Actinomycetes bacterium]